MALRILTLLALLGPALVAGAACDPGGIPDAGTGGGGGEAPPKDTCGAPDLVSTGAPCEVVGISCGGVTQCLCGAHYTPTNAQTSCSCRDTSGGPEWLCDDDVCAKACGDDEGGAPKVGTPNSYPATCVGASDYTRSLGCPAEKTHTDAEIADTCATIDARCPGEDHLLSECIVEKAITCGADGQVKYVDGDGCEDELQNVAYCLEHSG